MITALDKIIAYKHDEVAALKRARPVNDMMREVANQSPPRGFAQKSSSVCVSGRGCLSLATTSRNGPREPDRAAPARTRHASCEAWACRLELG